MVKLVDLIRNIGTNNIKAKIIALLSYTLCGPQSKWATYNSVS
jgi:hypothetical protein